MNWKLTGLDENTGAQPFKSLCTYKPKVFEESRCWNKSIAPPSWRARFFPCLRPSLAPSLHPILDPWHCRSSRGLETATFFPIRNAGSSTAWGWRTWRTSWALHFKFGQPELEITSDDLKVVQLAGTPLPPLLTFALPFLATSNALCSLRSLAPAHTIDHLGVCVLG